jgi:hypothetical protein
MIAEAEPFATARVIVTEVLQGLTRNVNRIEHYLSGKCSSLADSRRIVRLRWSFAWPARKA